MCGVPSPELDRDVQDYYAFFAFDPDGIRVEGFCWPSGAHARETPLFAGLLLTAGQGFEP